MKLLRKGRVWKGAVTLLSALALVATPSIATAQPAEEPAPQEYMTLTLERIDDLEGPAHPGDTLKFRITYKNISSQTITAFPSKTNLENVLTTAAKNCRWANLAPGKSASCEFGFLKVREADVEAGSVEPYVTYKATKERAGTTVLQDNITAKEDPVEVVPGVREKEDPAAIAKDRGDMEPVRLARAGDKYTCYRIPALAQANNGWLLAAYDGRPNSCEDSPNPNSIVLRISKDNGASWEKPTEIATGHGARHASDKYGYSDPSFVVNRETGRIHAFFVKSYDVRFQDSQPGTDEGQRNALHAAVTHSDDNGVTWSEPREITADITNDPSIRSRFAASGAGIQMRYGKYAGRLVQQYTMTEANRNYAAVSVYSDDDGETWKAGKLVGTGMDENKVVELSDGRLMLNSRPSSGPNYRKVAISEDGGETYGEVFVEQQLPDPRNNASIIRAYPNAEQGSDDAKILLYSSSSAQGRVNGLLRISYDDGQTWSDGKLFAQGPMAYSTLAALKDGSYGILYEGPNNDIMFAKFGMSWIEGLPVRAAASEANIHRGEAKITYNLVNKGDQALTGLTLTPQVPAGWPQVGAVELPALEPGRVTPVEVTVQVPAGASDGDYSFPATVTSGDLSSKVRATGKLAVREGEVNPEATQVELASNPPAETSAENNSAANLVDGNRSTIWHTPWGRTAELPIDVDLKLAQAERIVRVDVTPRQDASNGRIRTAELWAGDSADTLEKVADGSFADTPEVASFYLEKEAAYVRVRITGTYGDAQDKYASGAEAQVFTAPKPEPQPEPEEPKVAKPQVSYAAVEAAPGHLAKAPVAFANEAGEAVEAPEGTRFALEDVVPSAVPEYAAINTITGRVLVEVPAEAEVGSEISVPVRVSYADGEVASAKAIVKIVAPAEPDPIEPIEPSEEPTTVEPTPEPSEEPTVDPAEPEPTAKPDPTVKPAPAEDPTDGASTPADDSATEPADQNTEPADGKSEPAKPAPLNPRGILSTNSWTRGQADSSVLYGDAGDELFYGDWDGDGIDTPMVRRGNTFLGTNARTGAAQFEFAYGNANDAVLVGDWNGDGRDTVAVVRGNRVFVKDSLTGGAADYVVAYGEASDLLVAGDFDGNGCDELAAVRGNHFYLQSTIRDAVSTRDFAYGQAGDRVIAGDWNGDGVDGIGVVRANQFYLRNTLTGGVAEAVYAYGNANDRVLVGDWDGDGVDTPAVDRR